MAKLNPNAVVVKRNRLREARKKKQIELKPKENVMKN